MQSRKGPALTDIRESTDQEPAETTPPIDDASSEQPTSAENGPPAESDSEVQPESSEGDPPRWIRSAIRAVAAGIFVAVLAGAGYEGWLLSQHHQKDVAAAQALEAARKYAVTLTTADPNTVDQNVTAILDGSTGDFKSRYTKASSQLRAMLLDNKVTTHGSVVDSAVKSATKNKVEVLLFVKQSVSNSTVQEPHSDINAISMTMEKADGRWLAGKVLPREQGAE